MNHPAPQQIRPIGFFYRKQKAIKQFKLTGKTIGCKVHP